MCALIEHAEYASLGQSERVLYHSYFAKHNNTHRGLKTLELIGCTVHVQSERKCILQLLRPQCALLC